MMLFGLSNALVSLQKYINKILAKKPDVFVIVCSNDILIYRNETNYVNVI